MKRALLILTCMALAAVCGVPPAEGDVFGAIGLVSEGVLAGGGYQQQADYANDPAISADGRYVAFDGSFAGRRGVFRRDLATGEVAIVGEGDGVLPSISEDGRYVSFTTTARLDPFDDTNRGPDVYVRDMGNPNVNPCEVGEGAPPCAFTLASAVDGSSAGLTYKYASSNINFEETHKGSLAAGRSALSANGREVVFETTAESNLANPERTAGGGAGEPAETPASEVAVRDLDSDTTTLVSVRYDPATGGPALNLAGEPEPTPTSSEGGYGAIYPSGAQTPNFPSPFAGASLSADGSTVAWLGQQIATQAPVLPGADLADGPEYTEPLWRRIGDGQQAPTRRVTGGSDPTNPACLASGETQLRLPASLLDPCQGPFDTSAGNNGSEPGLWTAGTSQDYLPRLSSNGLKVAFLATAREVASGEEFGAGGSSDDLYVVDMQDGISRVAATTRLTELSGTSVDQARAAPIVDFGVSSDGTEIAFSTLRTEFPLGSPAYVSAPASAVGASELYDVDLDQATVTRVTQSFEGQRGEVPPDVMSFTGSPSFSGDGDLLAFASNSDNLAYGDGNEESDAFAVARERFASNPPAQEISSAPSNPAPTGVWRLYATALSRRDGSVLIDVLVPGSGTLRLGAQSAVRIRAARPAKRSKGGRRASRRGRTSIQTRTVAAAVKQPRGAELLALTLRLARSYSSLASARGGLSSIVTLQFSDPGHPRLRESLPVTFRRTLPRHRSPAAAHSKRRSRR